MSDPQYPEVPPTAPLPPEPTASLPPYTTPPSEEPPPATPRPPASPWAAPPPPGETVTLGPGTGGGGRIPKVVAIVVGVVALGGATAFAVQAFGNDETGAATPEEAATRLVEAIAEEDVLGVVDLLPDGERELLRDLTTDARDEYQRLGVLSDTFSLDGFEGVDIVAEDVEVDVDEITEELALVTITDGTFSIAVDGDELLGNLGDVVESVADERDAELEVDDVEDDADAQDVEASFAVIQEDGRWHPSLGFTIAELGRSSGFDDDGEPLDEPDFDDGVEPDGADSPEGAVQALIDAGITLDAEAAIAVLDPGEFSALQVYSQFFLPLAETDALEDVTIEAELTDADVDSLGGGVNRVVPTGFELRFEADGGTGEIILEDGCTSVDIQPPEDDDAEPIDEEFCFDDENSDLLPDELAEIDVPEELQEVAEAFLPLRFGIVTVERDGEHFIAPIRSLADVLLGLTRGLEREDLEEGGAVFALLSGELDEEVEELLDEVFESSFGSFEDEVIFDEGVFEPIPPEDCEGPGCGFGDPEVEEIPPRVETGASGPNGELLDFDVVFGEVAQGETATFTAVADLDADYLIGAQGEGEFDGVVTVLDEATGEVLGENDDFNGRDPEVLVSLVAGQRVTIQVSGFADDAGSFLVYFELF